MVGGAVLNKNYANMINADYYAKDAREAVKIAEKVYLKKISKVYLFLFGSWNLLFSDTPFSTLYRISSYNNI